MTKPSHPAFTVVGIGLMERSRLRLTGSFPDCRLFPADPAAQQQAHALCKQLGAVTLFVDVPPTSPMVHERASLVFNQANVKIIGLCQECDTKAYETILALEFSGAIAVDADDATYRRAAAAVHRGEIWVSREYLSVIARGQLISAARFDLSEREIDILKLMVEDSSNQVIADRLFLSRETIRWHLKSLYTKLGVSSRDAARRFAQNTLLNR